MTQTAHFDLKAENYFQRSQKGIWGICKRREVNCLVELVKKYQKTKTQTILDIGCGPGIYSMACRESFENLNLYGIDSSPIMHQKYIENGFEGECCDLNSFNAHEKTFNFVFALGIFEFNKDISPMLAKMRKLAESDTVFLILIPRINFFTGFYFLYHKIFNRIFIRSLRQFKSTLLNSGFTISESKNVFPVSTVLVCRIC